MHFSWRHSAKEALIGSFSCPFLQLANSEEFIDGAFTGNLGEILIRCNNVLYVRGAHADELSGADAVKAS